MNAITRKFEDFEFSYVHIFSLIIITKFLREYGIQIIQKINKK